MPQHWTWFRMLTALLVLPVVLMGGSLSLCSCHREVVYHHECRCGHDHAAPTGQTQQQPEHKHCCTHVEQKLQSFDGQVQLPALSMREAPPAGIPNARQHERLLHNLAGLHLARSRLWEPPGTIARPLLI